MKIFDYENKALKYSEKYGIVDYEVNKNKMIYNDNWEEGNYKCEVDLDTMKEIRKLN